MVQRTKHLTRVCLLASLLIVLIFTLNHFTFYIFSNFSIFPPRPLSPVSQCYTYTHLDMYCTITLEFVEGILEISSNVLTPTSAKSRHRAQNPSPTSISVLTFRSGLLNKVVNLSLPQHERLKAENARQSEETARKNEVATLNATITTRDNEISILKKQVDDFEKSNSVSKKVLKTLQVSVAVKIQNFSRELPIIKIVRL